MKLTRRRNGRVMTTVHTTHHLGSRHIADILCGYADSYLKGAVAPGIAGTPGADLTRAQVECVVRAALAGYGVGAYLGESRWDGYGEAYTDAEAARIAAWAVAQVRRLYPQLDDEELAAMEAEYPPADDEAGEAP